MQIEFHGAAGEVTGSCARVTWDGGCFLVDCGMFQGGRNAALKNLRALDFDLESIDFVLHACPSRLLGPVASVGRAGLAWPGTCHRGYGRSARHHVARCRAYP